MASSTGHRLVLFLMILLGVLSISASARPCKAFFISTYSFSVNPQNPNPNPIPNSHNLLFLNPRRWGSLTIFTQYNNPNADTIEIFVDRRVRLDDELQIQHHLQQQQQRQQQLYERQRNVYPFGFFSSQDFTSLRDRTKDILSVVVALLFGVGCGALAASTLYLVWTLFAHRYDYLHGNQFDSESESEEADESPKKMGYVKIPAGDK